VLANRVHKKRTNTQVGVIFHLWPWYLIDF